MKNITRTVWLLSLVSLFTDMASEMLYPIMPMFLQSIGFSVALIGVLEGIAEATAGLSKAYFGKRSDATGKRLPFVQLGYALSALSKPMMALFIAPLWIFFARFIDRMGKGIRTGARDAVLSDEATKETKGTVFGFHRSMDTLGAVIGPLLALVYLHYYPNQYRALLLLAFLPGVAAIAFSFLIKEKKRTVSKPVVQPRFALLSYWKESSTAYKKLVAGLLFFALFNSSDVFLLLMAKHNGMSDTHVIGVYIFYNLVYAIAAYPLGRMADKMGFKRTLVLGFILFAIVYAGMAISNGAMWMAVLFLLYGMYAACTEGVAKAWISNIAPKEKTATAIGTFSALQSLAALCASTLTGVVWMMAGAQWALLISAWAATVAGVYLWMMKTENKSMS